MRGCGGFQAGHDPHHMPALRSGDQETLRIAGRVRMVGEAIEFTAEDDQPPLVFHNHDPSGVAELIAADGPVSYAPQYRLLRFGRCRVETCDGEQWYGTVIVSVTTEELSPCRLMR